MRKINKFNIIIFILVLFISCGKNEHKPKVNYTVKKQKIKFDLSGFKKIDGKTFIKGASNREYLPTLFDLIDNAKSTIDVIQFELNNDRLIKKIVYKLYDAVKRGVKVRVLAEDSIEGSKNILSFMNNSSIEAKFDEKYIKIHSKMVIADGYKAIVGSTNWSYMSIDRNNETDIYIEGDIVKIYQNYFNSLWKGKIYKGDKYYTDKIIPLLNKDYYRYVMQELAKSKKEISVLMYGVRYYGGTGGDFTSDPILKSLVDAKNRGVKINIILEQSDYNDMTNKYNSEAETYLEKNGIKVYWDPIKTISHAKLLIVDDEVILGSANWGVSALKYRMETNAAVKDKSVLDYFKKYYSKVMSESSDNHSF